MCQVEAGLHFVLKADFGGARLWCKDDALPFKGGACNDTTRHLYRNLSALVCASWR